MALAIAATLAVAIPATARTNAPIGPAVAISLFVKSFTANVSGPIPLGAEILVTLVGSPGGRANFSIPNVVEHVTMMEVSGGVYIGRYTVVSGRDIDGATIVGQLIAKDGTQSPLLAAPNQISIDTLRPKLVNVFPDDGEQIATSRPVLYCGYDDGAGTGIDPQSIKVQVDGYDVTAASTIGKFGVSYQPAAGLAVGDHTFYVSVADHAGNPARTIQRFHIVAPSADSIRSVSANGPGKLLPGESVYVTLAAAAGGGADLITPPFPGTIHLSEVRPGTYMGKLTARAGDTVAALPLIVRLTQGSNNCSSTVDHTLTISAGAPLKPKITLPGDQDEFQGEIEMRGRAPANDEVVCTLSYSSSSLGGVMPFSGNVLTAVTRSSGKGDWHMGPFTLRLKSLFGNGSDTRLTLAAVTVDADGNESQPDTEPVAYLP
jgi:hypothetical protein